MIVIVTLHAIHTNLEMRVWLVFEGAQFRVSPNLNGAFLGFPDKLLFSVN
jgi:hypothetical protein